MLKSNLYGNYYCKNTQHTKQGYAIAAPQIAHRSPTQSKTHETQTDNKYN